MDKYATVGRTEADPGDKLDEKLQLRRLELRH